MAVSDTTALSEAGAPAVEITDEMVEAGVEAYYAADRRVVDVEYVVFSILEAGLAKMSIWRRIEGD